MIEEQARKRDRAWLVVAAVIAFHAVLGVATRALPDALLAKDWIMKGWFTAMLAGLAAELSFWFKGFYHWSRAKGYSGALAILGLLGFPAGPLVLAFLPDKCPPPTPPPDDPARNCPTCGAQYKLGDYDPAAKQILCSVCKSELPRT